MISSPIYLQNKDGNPHIYNTIFKFGNILDRMKHKNIFFLCYQNIYKITVNSFKNRKPLLQWINGQQEFTVCQSDLKKEKNTITFQEFSTSFSTQ